MRPIKFRAWDKVNKRMWWNVQNAYDSMGCHQHSECKKDEEWIDGYEKEYFPYSSFSEVLKSNELIIMQFTGLKDKNGIEIYEGDIVQIPNSNIKHKVEWDYNIEYDDRGSSSWYFGFSFEANPNNYIVIGNIYENPELLREK